MSEKNQTQFGLKVAYYRALQGLTQKELATKAGITSTYVSHIERGLKIPTFRLTIKIAKALKVDWKELTIKPISKKIEIMNLPAKEKEELNSLINAINNYLS